MIELWAELWAIPGEPFEYWCGACRQLRLSLKPELTHCGNCGQLIELRAKPGELDAEKLRAA